MSDESTSALPNRAELEAMSCWFTADHVSAQPEMTAFKRAARVHQARWRERHGFPMGSHRSGRPLTEKPNGSRLELSFARESGANFLSDRIRKAVKARLDAPERHQQLDEHRLWSDLLSSMPMCFNLFGELNDNAERLEAATSALWPGVPGNAEETRFEWSPGRQSNDYLNDGTAFDAAILLSLPDGGRSIIGIETKHHEHATTESPPDPVNRMPRYRKVAKRSDVFRPNWDQLIIGTPLQQIWRDHLLVLSMLQHPTDDWHHGRYVLVYPEDNLSFSEAARRYRDVLKDDATFEARTVESLLDAHVLHPEPIEHAFRDRYCIGAAR